MKKFLIGLLLLSGCYCWQPQFVNEPKCIMARGSVNCATQAVLGQVGSLMSIVSNALKGEAWETELAALEVKHGLAAVICTVQEAAKSFEATLAQPTLPTAGRSELQERALMAQGKRNADTYLKNRLGK